MFYNPDRPPLVSGGFHSAHIRLKSTVNSLLIVCERSPGPQDHGVRGLWHSFYSMVTVAGSHLESKKKSFSSAFLNAVSFSALLKWGFGTHRKQRNSIRGERHSSAISITQIRDVSWRLASVPAFIQTFVLLRRIYWKSFLLRTMAGLKLFPLTHLAHVVQSSSSKIKPPE